MSSNKPVVVVVDDQASMCDLVSDAFACRYEIRTFVDPRAALDALPEARASAVIADFRMQGMTGVELCRAARGVDPELPVIVMTAFGSLETSIEAMRAGAFDFVTKPVDLETLGFALDRAVKSRALTLEVESLRAVQEGHRALVGTSDAMVRLRALVARLAATDVSVLLTGESGTGKEVTARAIHDASARRRAPFVAINCAAMPEALFESELFGHVKGAFTDAKAARAGLLVEADGGTILLDEIGDAPLAIQPKLLRALEERKVRPVGGSAEVPFDARVLAATHRDLEGAIADGRFREDLFYRLAVVELPLPPLRARGDDVVLLASHLLEKHGARKLGPGVAACLRAYGWPGNVRELSNAIERAVALGTSQTLAIEDLPERVRHADAKTGNAPFSFGDEILPLAEMEHHYILHALHVLGQNRALTADALRIDRKTLYRRLERRAPKP